MKERDREREREIHSEPDSPKNSFGTRHSQKLHSGPDSPKNLSMSDWILKFFFIALNSNIEWTLQTLPKKVTYKSMGKYKSTGPPWDHIGLR